jgi:hypothetical protein
VMATELVRTQQGLVDAELRRQAGDAGLAQGLRGAQSRLGTMGAMASDVFDDIYARMRGLAPQHGPGQGGAGGLAAMAGGGTQRHVGGGYGGELPALVGPSNQIEWAPA